MRIRCLLAVALLIVGVPRAHADEAPVANEIPEERAARAAYDEGLTQYHLGHFDAAATAFKKAYELSKKPKLLFNIAQALRLGGHHADAIYFYRTYLRLVPDADNHADVEEFIAGSEHEVRAEQARQHAAVDEERLERERLHRAQEEARRDRGLHRVGLITMASGAVVAGVGVFFAVRASNAASDLTDVADAGGMWSDELARQQRDGERDDLIGTSLLYAGGAAVLTGVVIYTWSQWRMPGEPPARVVAGAGKGGASLCVGWHF